MSRRLAYDHRRPGIGESTDEVGHLVREDATVGDECDTRARGAKMRGCDAVLGQVAESGTRIRCCVRIEVDDQRRPRRRSETERADAMEDRVGAGEGSNGHESGTYGQLIAT